MLPTVSFAEILNFLEQITVNPHRLGYGGHKEWTIIKVVGDNVDGGTIIDALEFIYPVHDARDSPECKMFYKSPTKLYAEVYTWPKGLLDHATAVQADGH